MNAVGKTIRTTCPYCGVGCGVLATPRADGGVDIAGDPAHPANLGRLCVKGSALGETVGLDGRLLYPQLRSGSVDQPGWERLHWSEALDHAAAGLRRIVAEHGPESVALYVSGQLLTEDYYVANKFVKGWLGTANIDTNSRLCMSSAVAGHKRAFGEDVVPVCYEDLELADLVVLVGSNTAWCHPILFQRLTRAREQRPQLRIVVVDPRRTATCELADLHLPIAPGSDVALFNGLLRWLSERGHVDADFVAAHTRGYEAALAVAESLDEVAQRCGLARETLEDFYTLFAANERAITAFSMGVNQSSAGTDKVNAIINCHLATGRIGRPGMGPFSITGQPNAMGGREVGGLANMLAAHLDLEDATHRDAVQAFWNSPRIADRPGLKAVELFEAIESGRVRAVWIMATNPVVSLPNADQVKRALAKCELVIVSDCIANTDTAAYAHLLLPAQGWSEKDGTVTNSERRVSRQRAFRAAAGEARPDWWIIGEVAARLGFREGFGYRNAAEIFDEHARLSATAAQLGKRFDLSALSGLGDAAYEALGPQQWPVRDDALAARPYADLRFSTPDGRARFVAVGTRAPAHAPGGEYPLILNTGRVRDHWHTMTRTGLSPRLANHIAEPYVELHADDAAQAGIAEGELLRVQTRWGSLVARARSGGMARGQIFVPIHWSAQFASQARVGALVNPVVDPVSGEPEFKHTPARVERYAARWYGFVLSRAPLQQLPGDWWTRVTAAACTRYEIAGEQAVVDWPQAVQELAVAGADADWIDYEDKAEGSYRAACFVDGRLEFCVFVAARPELPSRDWLAGLFARQQVAADDRRALLAARPAAAGADQGPIVCSCFSVGRKTIEATIRERGLTQAAQITACLKAGGNCGSCVPELRAILAQQAARAA